jgi:hypothetical protein
MTDLSIFDDLGRIQDLGHKADIRKEGRRVLRLYDKKTESPLRPQSAIGSFSAPA